jgi:hypothetical protein
MPPEAPARTGWEALDAGRGLGRLLWLNPKWAESFDFSFAGFLRSFYGPLMALPFYLFCSALFEATQMEHPVTPVLLAVAAGEHLADALGYVGLVFLIARPLGIAGGVAAFVTVLNWRVLYLTGALGVASLLLMAGPGGTALFAWSCLVLLAVSLAVVWRAIRETLTKELAPGLLLVVLLVGWSVLMDQLSTWALAALPGGG